ncbi:uracil-DNA glycosylase [Boudabousia liubingyangii]|uniref:Uracil-DNA glycosylase n=1 Tax=Boudabousia liubingyangii TaxID=1921764 RepID=A0A1Q5PLF3_9ACTO|nr:uracil-DNA glycosylase [Boudabousia liubingyangii]OKL47876.1 uracil-DNA glycosylase [Boudabousia liubingyangii]
MNASFPPGFDPQWATALLPALPQLEQVLARVREREAQGEVVFPPSDDIFAAFSRPLSDVKVLILGQDPYPTAGHAMGLSFSVRPGVELPRSLRNIYQELQDDLGLPYPSSGDLRSWADQGVMLLNTILTVPEGQAKGHDRLGWQEFTGAALEILNGLEVPPVAVLWGRPAQALGVHLDRCPQVCAPHPSPLSARRGFFGSRPFSQINQILTQRGQRPIDWRLP